MCEGAVDWEVGGGFVARFVGLERPRGGVNWLFAARFLKNSYAGGRVALPTNSLAQPKAKTARYIEYGSARSSWTPVCPYSRTSPPPGPASDHRDGHSFCQAAEHAKRVVSLHGALENPRPCVRPCIEAL